MIFSTVKNKRENINGIEFSFPSFSNIISYSSIQLTNKFLYSEFSIKTIQGGLLDTKMGTINKNLCSSCTKNSKKCLGHFGYIKLFLPVFNIGYIKAIQIILQTICKACSRVLIEPGIKKKNLKEIIRKIRKKEESYRIEYIAELIKNCKNLSFCPYCHSKNGEIKKTGNSDFIHRIYHEEKRSETLKSNKKKNPENFFEDISLNPLTVFLLFQKIKFEDLELLDMDEIETRPENLILCFIPIPPLNIRPSIFVKEKITNEDDLTIKLSEIYNINNILKENLEKEVSFFQLKNSWNVLQIECINYLNSENFSFEKNYQPFKSLFRRLKGKNGRFRGNLSGKRVDFSGRTIISPDPNIPLNSLGFPIQLAKKLTFPEKVTKNNLERLQRNILRGSLNFPGAIFLINENKQKKTINRSTMKKNFLDIKEGYLIERHLKDNDIILFNRQPSLHRISIMAHRIKVIPGKTFKFNECVCKPYNADFDGDEMNIHVPQTQKARAEAISLLNMIININSPGTGESQVSATQDFLSASFIITCKDKFFSELEFRQIFALLGMEEIKHNTLNPAILKPFKLWTGKQIFSLLIFGTKKNLIFKKKKNIICDVNKLTFQKMEKLYSLKKNQCSPPLCPFDGWILFRKGKLLAGQIGKLTLGSGNKNSLLSFFSSLDSFSFLTRCLLRISKLTSGWFSDHGFSFGFNEILPTSNQLKKKKRLICNSYNICESIKNQISSKKKKNFESFLQKIFGNLRKDLGISCIDLFNLNKNSGLIMVASGSKGSIINLSQIIACLGQQSILGSRINKGFIKRVLPHINIKKSLSNPRFKGFIEKSFYEGLDGIDFFFHSMAGREGLVDTAIKTAESGYLQRRIVKTLEDIVIFYDLSTRTSDGRLIQLNFYEDCLDPNNLLFLYDSPRFDNQKLVHLIPFSNNSVYFFEKITLLRSISFISMDSISFFLKFRDFFFYFSNIRGLKNSFLFLYIEQYCYKILETSKKCHIEPGTCVGAIAAQSLGEPGTQMTLQTFHFTGISDMNITLGVPRINEILNASKKINVSFIKFNFFSMGKKENFFKFKLQIENIYLGEICEKLNIRVESKEIFIEIFIKNKYFKNFNLNINFKKIIKKIKNVGDFWKKSHFFYKPLQNLIKICPKKEVEINSSFFLNATELIYFCKKDLPTISAFGLVDSENIEIDKNLSNSSVLIKNANFSEVFQLDYIDKNSIYCTHILSVLETFGIEASRETIMIEIKTIFDIYKITINKKYLAILADVMTFHGEILGVTRYGLAKMKKNSLVLASFEKTIDNLFLAATKASKDEILSVSENIILGKRPPNGTGIVSLKSLN